MRGTRFNRWFFAISSLLVVCGLFAPVARADCPLYRLPTNRFGVDVAFGLGNITNYDVATLHLGWYSDWSSDLVPLRPGGIEYAQAIWIDAYTGEVRWTIGKGSARATNSWDALAQFVAANPGVLWLIGSEPECPYSPGGGRMTWQQYGDIYYQLYHFIKQHDSTANIAIGGVVEPTPLRQEWLSNLLDYYELTYDEPMPVDVWNIHVLILPEIRGDFGCGIPEGLTQDQGMLYRWEEDYSVPIFQQLVRDFRTWMFNHGQHDKPLIITEFGVLVGPDWGATPEVVNGFMSAAFDFLLNTTDAITGYPADSNHLVQRWLWCSLNDSPNNFNGALFDYQVSRFPGSLTAHGTNFISYTNSLLTALAGTACITGTVTMEARPAAPNASYVTTATLTLLDVTCPQPDIRSVKTDTSGRFTVCQVKPGTYDIIAKGFNTLAARAEDRVVPSSGLNVTLGLLPSGDADNDNRVTIADFTLLRAAYRTAVGDAAYDIRADFNSDGKVDLKDFSLLSTHFAQVGAQAW